MLTSFSLGAGLAALTLPEMPLGSENTPFSEPFLIVDAISASNELPSAILNVLDTNLQVVGRKGGRGRREGAR